MNRETYRRTTNTSFVIAVASVVLFDRFPHLHWLFGSLLLAAGIVAVVVHFYVQWHPAEVALAPRAGASKDSFLIADVDYSPREPLQSPLAWIDMEEVTVKFSVEPLPAFKPAAIDPNIVVEVCEKLAAAEIDFEITLTGDGNLTIRRIRAPKLGIFEHTIWDPRFTTGNPSTPQTVN